MKTNVYSRSNNSALSLTNLRSFPWDNVCATLDFYNKTGGESGQNENRIDNSFFLMPTCPNSSTDTSTRTDLKSQVVIVTKWKLYGQKQVAPTTQPAVNISPRLLNLIGRASPAMRLQFEAAVLADALAQRHAAAAAAAATPVSSTTVTEGSHAKMDQGQDYDL